MPAEQPRSVYTLEPGTPRHALEVTIRGALTALRADLEYLALLIGPDDLWTDDVEAALTAMDLPEVWRNYVRGSHGGIADDLDPRDPVQFEVGLLLAPFAKHAMSITRQSAGECASYDGGSHTRFALTPDQHSATVRYMTARDVDPSCLVPAPAGS
ncbi:MAG TPA: hypothetical protein VFJ94_07315 [Intrasporangium sp.]|uniref:hypothetical protein n=1 Tax=Intrasporangium sp. TaxID=1925024 RepID=UPI002D76BADA|nr:hypothetical protein [Intrasporangium sp.]HET7398315.1 hypothetical protein [Intrasporangium sp.]